MTVMAKNEENLYAIAVKKPLPITDGSSMLERISSMVVVDADSYRVVADIRKNARDRAKEIEAQRVEMKAPSLEAGRRVDDFFNPVIKTFEAAAKIASDKLQEYERKQELIAEQKRREAEEAARKEREKLEAERRERERKEAEAKAEQERAARQAAEAKAAQERAARAAAEARAKADKDAAAKAEQEAAAARQRAVAARAEEMKANREAAAAKEAAEKAEAESRKNIAALENAAETTAPERVAVEGLSRVTTYGWTLIDKMKLKPEYLIVDEKAINAIVRAQKERAAETVGAGAIEITTSTSHRQR